MLNWLELLPDIEKTKLLEDGKKVRELVALTQDSKNDEIQLKSAAYFLAMRIESDAKQVFGDALVEQAKLAV